MKVLIVGNGGATHVGGHFLAAGKGLEGDCISLLPTDNAFRAPRMLRALYWRLLGHRPPRLRSFSQELIRRCKAGYPDLVLATGLAPISAAALDELKRMKIRLANFLTDDPWNKAHRAPWFMKGLGLYDFIFTPRHANEAQIQALNHPAVHYLPFAYNPEIHCPPVDRNPTSTLDGDKPGLLFVGGADKDRTETMLCLQRRNLPLELWGGYWKSVPGLRKVARGHAEPETFRSLVSHAAINLCLRRRANRDGHCMRTFEIPAIGGCMLVEDTEDHRALFGEDGVCVRYFNDIDQLELQARHLLGHPSERRELAAACHQKICGGGGHTYADRLRSLLAACRDAQARHGFSS